MGLVKCVAFDTFQSPACTSAVIFVTYDELKQEEARAGRHSWEMRGKGAITGAPEKKGQNSSVRKSDYTCSLARGKKQNCKVKIWAKN